MFITIVLIHNSALCLKSSQNSLLSTAILTGSYATLPPQDHHSFTGKSQGCTVSCSVKLKFRWVIHIHDTSDCTGHQGRDCQGGHNLFLPLQHCCCPTSIASLQASSCPAGTCVIQLVVAWSQDAKLLRLEASLQQREEQIENHHAERINALRSRRSREVQQKLAYIHR